MFFISLLAVVAMEYFEKVVIISLAPSILELLPANVGNVLKKITPALQIHKDSYYTLLSTVAGMSGIFLGLYFTALSVVAQGIFKDVPSVIRDLLVREKVGNVYVRTLAILTSISLLMLGYMSLGEQPGVLCSLVVVIMSCFGVLCFVFLGVRVFYFFDLAQLAPSIFDDLRRCVRLATIEGYGWKDPAFQAWYNKEFIRHMGSARTISEWTINNVVNESRPLKTIVQLFLHFMAQYQHQRSKIPTDSKWYVQTPRHEDWFLVSETKLTTALQTQTGIQPDFTPGWNWVEDEIISVYGNALSKTLSTGKLSDVRDLVRYGGNAIQSLGSLLDHRNSDKLVEAISSTITTHLEELDPNVANDLARTERIDLALLDHLGYVMVDLSMRMIESIVAGCSENGVSERVTEINWSDRHAIYRNEFPLALLSQCEYVYSRLQTEIRSEGHQISPPWYIQQLVLMTYSEICRDALRLISKTLKNRFVELCKELGEKKYYIYGSQHVSRGLELCEKLSYHFPKLKRANEQLMKHYVLRDLKWPDWELDAFAKIIEDTRSELVVLSANTLPFLALKERNEEVPDYFGQAYNTVYSQAHYLLQKNDPDQFREIFPPLFFSAIQAYERLRKHPKLQQQESITLIGFSTEPIMDLLDISGYAKIYSELHQNPALWDQCTAIWDKFFSSLPDSKEMVKAIIAIDYVRRFSLRLFSRDVLRTNWQMQFENRLRQLDLIDDFASRGRSWDEHQVIKHPSPFIRALCLGRHEPMISAVDVFLLIYLRARSEAADLDIQDRYGFLQSLEKETSKDTSGEKF